MKAAVFFLVVASLRASDFSIEALKEPAPKEIAAPIQETLQTEAIRVLGKGGKPLLDIWLRKDLPRKKLEGKPPASIHFSEIEEGALLGAIRVHKKHADFRDLTLPAGVFTMRYGLQPVDGNHVGTADSRDFALLCAISEDGKPDLAPAKRVQDWSAKASGSKHPSILYVLPRTEKRESFPALDHDAEKDWRILDLRIPVANEKEQFFRLGLVVAGATQHP